MNIYRIELNYFPDWGGPDEISLLANDEDEARLMAAEAGSNDDFLDPSIATLVVINASVPGIIQAQRTYIN